MGDALVDAANRDLAAGDQDAARERARHTLTVDPDSAAAYAVLGIADWADGRITDSNRELRRALAHEPRQFGASLALARNLRASGDLAESQRLLDALVAADPKQELPRIGLLDTAWVAGDFDTVRRVAKELRPHLHPDSLVSQEAQGVAEVGELLEGTGPWRTVDGLQGSVPLRWGDDLPLGIVGAKANGAHVRVSTNWGSTMTEVTTEWLDSHPVPAQGSVSWPGQGRVRLVVIPRIDFGEIALERIPAIVLPKGSAWHLHGADVILGRHGLTAFGSLRMDGPNATAEFSREPPETPGRGSIVAPLFFLGGHIDLLSFRNTLATVLRLEPSGSEIAVYLGAYPAGLVVTDSAWARGKVDEADAGSAKPVHAHIAGRDARLEEVIVLEAGAQERTIEMMRVLTSLQLRGSLNPSALESWVVTYAPSSARLILEPAGGQ